MKLAPPVPCPPRPTTFPGLMALRCSEADVAEMGGGGGGGYDVQLLVNWLRGRHLLIGSLIEVELLRQLVVGLRLPPWFWSVDMAQLSAMLYPFAGAYYLRTVDTNDK